MRIEVPTITTDASNDELFRVGVNNDCSFGIISVSIGEVEVEMRVRAARELAAAILLVVSTRDLHS